MKSLTLDQEFEPNVSSTTKVLLLTPSQLTAECFQSKVADITAQMFRYILFIEHATVKLILCHMANQIIIKFNESVKKSCGMERE